MLGKLSDTCVVHMTPDTISFGVAASSNSGVHACAELSTHSLFLDYRIESRAENNRISFFVKIDNLSRALKSSSANANSKSLVGPPSPDRARTHAPGSARSPLPPREPYPGLSRRSS